MRPPNLTVGWAGTWPKVDDDAVEVVDPNALLEEKGAAAGAGGAPPNGLGEEEKVLPPNALEDELNGDLVGTAVDEAVPNGELLFASTVAAPPKTEAVVFAVGPVTEDADVEAEAPPETLKGELLGGMVVPNGDFEVLTPNEEDKFPRPNDDGPDEGAASLSNGLDVLYFVANFVNISTSFPLYFSNVFATSGSLWELCF